MFRALTHILVFEVVSPPGKSSIATAEDLQDYEDRKRELEEERERRKRVGADVGKVCTVKDLK